MRKSIISLLLALGVAAMPVQAGKLSVRPDAPQRYTVVPGDTLWGISGRYLKKPWDWPRLWQMNRSEVKNPHRIYPGDVLVLEWVNGQPRLRREGSATRNRVVKLSPQIRVEQDNSIYSIPNSKIEPFLRRSRIVEKAEFDKSPTVLAGPTGRLVLSTNDRVYATGITEPGTYQAYRAERMLYDPDTREPLGYEVLYGGDLKVDKLEEPVQSLRVISSQEEIVKGDHLLRMPDDLFINYAPHPAAPGMEGKIISGYEGVEEVGQFASITINRGSRDGVEVGHVFTVKQAARTIDSGKTDNKGYPVYVSLPQETIGTLFIYRVYDRIAYGIVMDSTDSINMGDNVIAPADDD